MNQATTEVVSDISFPSTSQGIPPASEGIIFIDAGSQGVWGGFGFWGGVFISCIIENPLENTVLLLACSPPRNIGRRRCICDEARYAPGRAREDQRAVSRNLGDLHQSQQPDSLGRDRKHQRGGSLPVYSGLFSHPGPVCFSA